MTVNEKTAWNVLSANAKKATTKTKKKSAQRTKSCQDKSRLVLNQAYSSSAMLNVYLFRIYLFLAFLLDHFLRVGVFVISLSVTAIGCNPV